MSRKEHILSVFRKMGYEPMVHSDFTNVIFRTNGGYLCMVTLHDEDFEKDFIVEWVVAKLNAKLKRFL